MVGKWPEVDLSAGAAVIGDLHLDTADEERAKSFTRWLEALAVPRLVILGDLFDAWLGPGSAGERGAGEVIAALAAARERGVLCDLVPGNRDFLLDGSFERTSGCTLHPAGALGLLADGGRAVFVHGDELCTEDRAYQRYKRLARARAVRWLGARLPRGLARAIGRRLRRASSRAVAAKTPAYKALQPAAARDLAAAAGAATLVCGHAHQARDERLDAGLRWIVLDAYGGERDELRIGAAGELELVSSTREV
ncbi:MAG: UDP-2,3-diacylglucosamine diphosphatase [Planctomycetes bacterium]|jgi:UDP-2,3-diacylglucosamine hydrolase|nr:UDP-2,3-diacylglucosamine diphosphatase [Planctomycetota bacterium]MDP6410700.1 UDP-2,3-diacylglucosamine diphosphatase [Planctomycetota bacterium]